MAHWLYEQRTGNLYRPDGALATTGYSGYGIYKNDPTAEARVGEGPIPRGDWSIAPHYDSPQVGPFALPLTPIDIDAHGRKDFRIHGDSISSPGKASHGCVIIKRPVREQIEASGVKTLRVIAG